MEGRQEVVDAILPGEGVRGHRVEPGRGRALSPRGRVVARLGVGVVQVVVGVVRVARGGAE